jgi:tyrosine phenol-lyase
MISEPYKIKEVKKFRTLKSYEKWNVLRDASFNTFHIRSDFVNFDLVSRGMSAWSHFQKAVYMAGDEAYAGSRSYRDLVKAVKDVLGLDGIVPAHNGIGAEKLLVTSLLEKDRVVLHNRGITCEQVLSRDCNSIDITRDRRAHHADPQSFGADVDLDELEKLIQKNASNEIAYVHIETCPRGLNRKLISWANLAAIKELTEKNCIPLIIDISNIFASAYWISNVERRSEDIVTIARSIVEMADVVLMDASQDFRSDVGGFISCKDADLLQKLQNIVVVYEGMHTYGGMTGRAMAVFSQGLKEALNVNYSNWYQEQIGYLYDKIRQTGVPVYRGGNGIGLDAGSFLSHLGPVDCPKFVLAASLYLHGSIRGRIDGVWSDHVDNNVLMLELPKCAYTKDHLDEIARVISSVYAIREEITGLRLINEPHYVDEAKFETHRNRLFVPINMDGNDEYGHFEKYKIAIFEPLKTTDKDYRKKLIEEAGYNPAILEADDVYLDFFSDSGTSAMSGYQWEGMLNSADTPFSNRHYLKFLEEFKEVLGYNYVIPTHQGRAAEHIMSQTLIRPGQIVPGNMYFTTTKHHQEMAGGIFEDVIVDEAHDPDSTYPWKGNIDLEKLERLIKKNGPENIAYISYELSVNMAGGQPVSMQNVRDVSRLCQKHNVLIMFDATRCVENACMIQMKDPEYAHCTVKDILREILSYGDGCTISCKKDFLVNMGGVLACNNSGFNQKFQKMLRIWEGDITNGGLDAKDLEALNRGLLDALDDNYITMRIEQTQYLGNRLNELGIPIVNPPGSHAIFLDAKKFLPHIDQGEYPGQALVAALYLETGIRGVERGIVSKGRDPKTNEEYRPDLELVRLAISRRVYTQSHMDYVIEGINRLYEKREKITGLKWVYEPPALRFFQGRFKPIKPWDF